MNSKFKVSEEEKNRIKGLHLINEQSGFVVKQEGSDRLSKFNSRQEQGEGYGEDLGEQMEDNDSLDYNMEDLTNHLTKEILMEYCKHSHRGGCPRACRTDKPVLAALHSWCKTNNEQTI